MADPERHRSGAADPRRYWPVCTLSPSICDAALFPRVRWDAGLRYTFLTLSRYVFIFLGLWWGLSTVHMNWSSIQWIVAAVSVGVGFGLQEIVSNFVSGLIILLERPIRVDDTVTVGDQTGTVKRITIRATAIQCADNQTVIIPNKEFIARMVTNWTLGDPRSSRVICESCLRQQLGPRATPAH